MIISIIKRNRVIRKITVRVIIIKACVRVKIIITIDADDRESGPTPIKNPGPIEVPLEIDRIPIEDLITATIILLIGAIIMILRIKRVTVGLDLSQTTEIVETLIVLAPTRTDLETEITLEIETRTRIATEISRMTEIVEATLEIEVGLAVAETIVTVMKNITMEIVEAIRIGKVLGIGTIPIVVIEDQLRLMKIALELLVAIGVLILLKS